MGTPSVCSNCFCLGAPDAEMMREIAESLAAEIQHRLLPASLERNAHS
ncbi:hypothetical protein [Streptomyces sp. NPDC058202]